MRRSRSGSMCMQWCLGERARPGSEAPPEICSRPTEQGQWTQGVLPCGHFGDRGRDSRKLRCRRRVRRRRCGGAVPREYAYGYAYCRDTTIRTRRRQGTDSGKRATISPGSARHPIRAARSRLLHRRIGPSEISSPARIGDVPPGRPRSSARRSGTARGNHCRRSRSATRDIQVPRRARADPSQAAGPAMPRPRGSP